VPAAAPGSFDSVLAQAGLPLLALDLANAPQEGPVAAWLATEMQMRSIGGIYGFPEGNTLGVVYTATVKPREGFDAVMFVAETSAAHRNQAILPVSNSTVLPAPTNLDLSGGGIPTEWQTVGAGRTHAHAIAMSQEHTPRGGRTVCLSREAPWRWGEGQLTQKIFAQAFQGRRLRFSASIRTLATDVGAGALLFLRFWSKPAGDEPSLVDTPLATVASSEQPLHSPHWTTIAVEADLSESADTFVIGLIMSGNGVAWFGDLEFSAGLRSN